MTTAFVFDLDGTLTEPRQRIVFRVAQAIQFWSYHNDLYLLSGSNMPKIKDQLFYLTRLFKGCYLCGGNEYWQNDNIVEKYPDSQITTELFDWFVDKLLTTRYPNQLMGNHIECRSGMINFSIVGRGEKKYDGDLELRTESRAWYSNWDKRKNERQSLVSDFNRTFGKQYHAEVAGETGIDIYELNRDKGQVYSKLKKQYERIFFFGKDTEKGGNNYSFAVQCESPDRIYNVEKPTDILDQLTQIRTDHGTVRIS